MAKYYIDYGTGVGNEWIDGSLDDAKDAADKGAAYTQKSITISDENGNDICVRTWYGYDFENELDEDGNYLHDDHMPDVIQFGSFGFYDEWRDYD